MNRRTPIFWLALATGLLQSVHAQAPAPNGSLRFLVVGDWGRRGQFHQKETAEQMGKAAKKLDAQFVLTTGDNLYSNGVQNVSDPLWKASFEDVYTAKSLMVPWYVALGNHDYHENPQAEVEYTLFSPRWKMPARYYTVTYQIAPQVSAEFFVTDTTPIAEVNKDHADQRPKEQVAWLQRELARSTAQWKFVTGHHPVYSGGKAHGDTAILIADYKPLFEKYGVQAYFCGHDHDLQAIHEGPVYYLLSGAGSQVREGVVPHPHTLFSEGSESGFLSAKLTADQMEYQFIDWEGNVLFTGQVPRVPAP